MRISSRFLTLFLVTQAKLQNTQLSSNDRLAPTLSCGKAKIEIVIKKQFLRRHGIRTDNTDLHFGKKSRECFSFDSGDSFTLTLFSPFTGCETIVEHGEDDYVYSNEITFSGEDKKISIFQFRCIYEDKYIVSSGPISPTKRTLQFTTADGEFEVAMDMFRSDTFSFMDKHQDRPSIKLNDPVFVQIEYATTFGWSDLTMSLQNCYATDTPEFNEHMRYHPLISGMCRSPEDDSVEIIENGMSSASKFKFNMFKWRGVIAYIYLHCEVHVCNSTMEMCYGEGPTCHGQTNRRKKRSVQGAQHYSIQADLSDLEGPEAGQSEGFVNYDLLEKKDEAFDPIADYMPEPFADLPEESQLTDFITRGPILIDDESMNNVGQGSIETTMHAISYDDDFLRIYIFSTIAVLICLVAVVMACLLALKRRKTQMEKVTSINPVMSSTQSADVPNLGFSTAGLTPEDLRLGAYKSTSKALPAITGLPLPPTPKDLENSSDENRSVTSSENSKRNLMKEQTRSYNPVRHNSFAGNRSVQSGRPRLSKVESQRLPSAYRR